MAIVLFHRKRLFPSTLVFENYISHLRTSYTKPKTRLISASLAKFGVGRVFCKTLAAKRISLIRHPGSTRASVIEPLVPDVTLEESTISCLWPLLPFGKCPFLFSPFSLGRHSQSCEFLRIIRSLKSCILKQKFDLTIRSSVYPMHLHIIASLNLSHVSCVNAYSIVQCTLSQCTTRSFNFTYVKICTSTLPQLRTRFVAKKKEKRNH